MAGRNYIPWGELLGIGLKSECEAVAQACVSGFCVKDGRGMEGWTLGQWTSLQLRGFGYQEVGVILLDWRSPVLCLRCPSK